MMNNNRLYEIRVPILMYHSIGDTWADVAPGLFRRQMAYLSKAGYESISLDDLYLFLKERNLLPRRPFVITFDDGYKDNYMKAFPILKKYNFKATIFLVTDFMSKTNLWNKDRGVLQRPLLSWDEVYEMDKYGISFGAHTCTHSKLPEIEPDKGKEELVRCKKEIENRLGKPCHFMAYPYGLFNENVKRQVMDADFLAGCSVRIGFTCIGDDPFVLKRIPVLQVDSPAKLVMKLYFRSPYISASKVLKYYLSRIKAQINKQ